MLSKPYKGSKEFHTTTFNYTKCTSKEMAAEASAEYSKIWQLQDKIQKENFACRVILLKSVLESIMTREI